MTTQPRRIAKPVEMVQSPHAAKISKLVSNTAKAARKGGQHVEVNNRIPYISVYRGEDDEYFFQGDEALDLIHEYEYNPLNLSVSLEDYILYVAQGW